MVAEFHSRTWFALQDDAEPSETSRGTPYRRRVRGYTLVHHLQSILEGRGEQIGGHWSNATHPLERRDWLALRLRTKQNKGKAKSLVQLIGLLRFDFIDVISKCLNSYIEYKVQNDSRFAVARNLPAIRRKSRSDRPVRVEVDPETIWALMESAKYSSVSLRQALLLKKDDSMSSPELAGASEAKAEYWSRKITGLYINRVQNVFKMVTQLSLVADASTHSGKEILVSCAYAPSEKLGCHAVIALEHGIFETFGSGCFSTSNHCKE